MLVEVQCVGLRRSASARGLGRPVGEALARTSESKIAGGGTRGQLCGGTVWVQVAGILVLAITADTQFGAAIAQDQRIAKVKNRTLKKGKGCGTLRQLPALTSAPPALEVSFKPGPFQIKGSGARH